MNATIADTTYHVMSTSRALNRIDLYLQFNVQSVHISSTYVRSTHV